MLSQIGNVLILIAGICVSRLLLETGDEGNLCGVIWAIDSRPERR